MCGSFSVSTIRPVGSGRTSTRHPVGRRPRRTTSPRVRWYEHPGAVPSTAASSSERCTVTEARVVSSSALPAQFGFGRSKPSSSTRCSSAPGGRPAIQDRVAGVGRDHAVMKPCSILTIGTVIECLLVYLLAFRECVTATESCVLPPRRRSPLVPLLASNCRAGRSTCTRRCGAFNRPATATPITVREIGFRLPRQPGREEPSLEPDGVAAHRGRSCA